MRRDPRSLRRCALPRSFCFLTTLAGCSLLLAAAPQTPAQTLIPRTAPPPQTTPQTLDPLAPRDKQNGPALSPITTPTLSPGIIELLKLEGMFQQDVAKGGGKAFASWFAEDAVTLNNGKAPVLGRAAITAAAQWDPANYQLTWYAEGAQMGPSGDTGFAWGHYDATAKDQNGNPVKTAGRYITFWKKVSGRWLVAMDASADDTANPGDCCKLPSP